MCGRGDAAGRKEKIGRKQRGVELNSCGVVEYPGREKERGEGREKGDEKEGREGM